MVASGSWGEARRTAASEAMSRYQGALGVAGKAYSCIYNERKYHRREIVIVGRKQRYGVNRRSNRIVCDKYFDKIGNGERETRKRKTKGIISSA